MTGIHTIQDVSIASQDDSIEELTQEFVDIFNASLGKYKGTSISFNLDPNVAPIQLNPKRVLFALRPKIL